jgi:DNA-binding PadR family transcriptional regulator
MTDRRRGDMSEQLHSELTEEELSLDAFPEDTDAVLEALGYHQEEGSIEIYGKGLMTRSDIADMIPPEIGLNKDQVKYRVEQLVDHDLVAVEWRDHPDTRTPTAYYTLTLHGEYVAATQVRVEETFGRDPEEIEREDIYALVDELQQTRIQVGELSERVQELEERLEQEEEEEDDEEGGTTGFGPR